MRLTRRGAGMLAFAVLAYVAGELLGYPLFRALAGAALSALAVGVGTVLRRPRVAVERDVYPDRVERGSAALARLRVRNPSGRRQPGGIAHDLLGRDHRRVVVRPLAPGETATYHYELPTRQRGRLLVGPLVLERTDLLGLVTSRAGTGEPAVLWVHPRRHPVRSLAGLRPRHHHTGAPPPDPLRGSTDLRAVREYVVGDEVRHLHWKAVARTGTLMVREYVDPAQPRFSLLLDDRAGVLSAAAFEEAVEVAASLLYTAAAGGQHTQLRTTTGLAAGTAGGLAAARTLLDRLCELEQTARPAGPARAETGGGTLVYVTGGRGAADAGTLAALRGSSERLAVFDLDPGRDAPPPWALAIRAEDAATAVRAWNRAVAR